MNNSYTFACGQGATKAMIHCIEDGTLLKEDCCIVNSTQKDIPYEYRNGSVSTIIINPDPNAGCGKDRGYAKSLMLDYLRNNPNVISSMLPEGKYQYVNIIATTEGASGSGASVILAKFIKSAIPKHLRVPVVITLITGFETDTRGLQNTIEYFKDLNGGDFVIRTVSNKKYLDKTNNTFTAEKMANEDISKSFKIISAFDVVDSEQNIDDEDHYKLITNPGMMFVTEVEIDKRLKNSSQFEQIVSDAIDYNTSLDFEPSATKIGVYMNISDDNLSVVDTNFTAIKKKLCGNTDIEEFFIHRQYVAAQPEFVRIIASGINLPKDELNDIYNKYQNRKEIEKQDDFFDSISGMVTESNSRHSEEDDIDDSNTNDFFANFEGEVSHGSGRRKSSSASTRFSSNNTVKTTDVSGGYEKKKNSFTAKISSNEVKPYSEDSIKGF